MRRQFKIKTIDVNAKEWFDRINGNSYFAGTITLNYGMKSQKDFIMPFQYGYGEQYLQEAEAVLTEHNYISADYGQALWTYCRDNKIILRTNKQENCKKAELKAVQCISFMKRDYVYKNYYIWRGSYGYYITRTPEGAQLVGDTLKSIKFLINGNISRIKREKVQS